MHAEAIRLIEELQLHVHPEGGYYREVFRSSSYVISAAGAQRSAMTSIYYLLDGGSFSNWHRLDADETWHFYCGSPLTLTIIDPAGNLSTRTLSAHGPWQTTIALNAHFAAHVADESGYALVGCNVAPGFEFADFHLATRAILTAAYPQHAAVIARYART
ncbi:MAG TPA: cupin domain-containing protein [Candidatus Acidoferrales bacterium]|nr:cupin domain-containing protein [Candidatus Acidoferrales bacterium]